MEFDVSSPCPCRTLDAEKPAYSRCCQPFHEHRASGEVLPDTAEQLMRSRYSAFVLGLAGYLLLSWHETTRPADLQLDGELHWEGLQIVKTRSGEAQAVRGVVEFIAHYAQDGQRGSQHEVSTFVRENGAWFYLDAL